MNNKSDAATDFTYMQDIKRTGTHLQTGLKVDAYYRIVGDTLEIYCEESNQKIDWLVNFIFLPYRVKIKDKVRYYHRGFYYTALEIYMNLVRNITKHKVVKVYGYSLGGAAAQILSDMLDLKTCTTFGTPNNVFMNKSVKENRKKYITYRQGLDIVTFIPPFPFKKYGIIRKLPGRGNPIKSHDYYHLDRGLK